MLKRKDGPLLVQSDGTVLLDDSHSAAEEARERLARFAELVKRPGTLHTYRMTPLAVWNACSQGMSGLEIREVLEKYSRSGVPAAAAAMLNGMDRQIRGASVDAAW